MTTTLPTFVKELAIRTNMDMDDLVSDPDMFNTSVRSLAQNLSSYSNQEISGQCLIWNITRKCSLESYLTMYSGKLSPDCLDFMTLHKQELSQFLSDNDSLNYYNKDFFSASTLISNYFFTPSKGSEPFETPLLLFLRVAVQLYKDLSKVKEVTLDMAKGYYIPSSPTLFNSGTLKHQLASCFLIPIQDKLDDILYTGVGDAGMISSLGGGLGMGFTNVRHSEIGDRGKSNGVVPMCRLVDKLIEYADQSGRRKGAATAFLAIWHIDLMEFIEGTNNFNISADEKFTSLNTCIWTNDLFFERINENGDWTLFCPAKADSLKGLYGQDFELEYVKMENDARKRSLELDKANNNLKQFEEQSKIGVEINKDEYAELCKAVDVARKMNINHKVIKAKTIFAKITELQIKSGMPYLCHGDSINSKSNHKNIGPINNSNLCLEIMEATPDNRIASCNLASMNLAAYVTEDKTYDFGTLGVMVQRVVENLNAVIDTNYYPLDTRDSSGKVTEDGKISSLNYENRPIGLGCSGFSDAMAKLDITPESNREITMNKKIFACMYFNALIKSVELAIRDGPYETFSTGSTEVYDGIDIDPSTGHCTSKYSSIDGSPFSNGMLQFDLWQERARILEDSGKLTKVYKKEDDIPVDPKVWEQKPYVLSNGEVISPSWDSLKRAIVTYGVRNSLLLALMPTASSAQAIRNAETTEYHQSNIYSRMVQSGNFIVINRWLANDLEELSLWNENVANFVILSGGSVKYLYHYFEDHDMMKTDEVRERVMYIVDKYKTQFEISRKHSIKMSRQRGIYIDQSQSFNLYIDSPTSNQLQAAHMYGNYVGNKVGMYYLRAKSPNQTGSFGMDSSVKLYYESLMDRLNVDKVENTSKFENKSECAYCS